jgi:hypothetical protein
MQIRTRAKPVISTNSWTGDVSFHPGRENNTATIAAELKIWTTKSLFR